MLCIFNAVHHMEWQMYMFSYFKFMVWMRGKFPLEMSFICENNIYDIRKINNVSNRMLFAIWKMGFTWKISICLAQNRQHLCHRNVFMFIAIYPMKYAGVGSYRCCGNQLRFSLESKLFFVITTQHSPINPFKAFDTRDGSSETISIKVRTWAAIAI